MENVYIYKGKMLIESFFSILAYAEIIHLQAGTNVKIITAAFPITSELFMPANTEFLYPGAFITADSWDGAQHSTRQIQKPKSKTKTAKSPPAVVSA